MTLKPAAQRQIGRLKGVEYVALRGVLLELGANPRPRGSAKLAGGRGLWRLRFRIDGRGWRVVYTIDDTERVVVITRVVARDDGTYRSLR